MNSFGVGASGGNELLSLLADPKAAKKKLEEMDAAQKRLQDVSNDARDALNALHIKEFDLREREQAIADARAHLTQEAAYLGETRLEMQQSQGRLAEAQAKYAVDRATLDAERTEFDAQAEQDNIRLAQWEATLNARETDLVTREAEAKERAKRLRDALA